MLLDKGDDMRTGYAYAWDYPTEPDTRTWRNSSDDDWQIVVVGETEIQGARCAGQRTIDGALHDVWVSSRGVFAQLSR